MQKIFDDVYYRQKQTRILNFIPCWIGLFSKTVLPNFPTLVRVELDVPKGMLLQFLLRSYRILFFSPDGDFSRQKLILQFNCKGRISVWNYSFAGFPSFFSTTLPGKDVARFSESVSFFLMFSHLRPSIRIYGFAFSYSRIPKRSSS